MLATSLILTAIFAWLAWRDLHVGFLLLVALLPSYLLRTEFFGVPTTFLEMLLITFVIVWCMKRRPHVSWIRSSLAPLTLPILLLAIASILSLAITPDFLSALGVWKAYYLEPILLFVIIRHERLDAARIFKALGVCAIILSLIAIAQWLTGKGIPIPWDVERRVTSVFDYPNALGLFLGPIAVIGALSWRTTAKWFWIPTTILPSMAIVLAQSEAAIVAILTTLALAGLLNKQTRTKTILAITIAIVAVALSPWRGFVAQKLTLQDFSGQVRLTQWSETVQMLQDRWLLGAGLSGYPTVFAPYHQATHIEIFQYPHNLVLNVWVELGLMGVITLGVLAFMVVRKVTSRLFHSSAALIAFFAVLETAIHGLVDVPYFKNDLAILTWVLLAIIYASHETLAKKES
ncbi:O-antigen ligase family protein [Candidatus Uhrbacteria bacterium]|nr:O-antigen ligase family protein [Candidatus Uhrbacteria bacterium]